MAEYLSDVEESDYDFEFDGCPYRFEPEFTDEELHERRMRRERDEQLAREQQTEARPRLNANWWWLVDSVRLWQQKRSVFAAQSGT